MSGELTLIHITQGIAIAALDDFSWAEPQPLDDDV
jgi:hypothetical protein